MKKTLALALALGFVVAGCAEEPADDIDATVVEPAPVVTEPADDMMMSDTTMMNDDMMADTTAMDADVDTTAGL